ncbi:SDR family NAD(P)-dependent oxidoreductase [Cytobacillus massiliigabonensis]|uniref:SDR family NAD(P)-dependent oxidoreductase n=1 Tax=Cytobacillus massiliigabonensis TaxID=1871011 RepID=UPI000C822C41|nr:SDR family NAD(P)-dependent oxidoreductase [Cytobacillus massiliigabonensis]
MHERYVIITGANSGIGKAAAIQFASKGCTVIMACRNLETSKAAHSEIIKASNNKNIHLMKVDMSSFRSIQNFCTQFISNYGNYAKNLPTRKHSYKTSLLKLITISLRVLLI